MKRILLTGATGTITSELIAPLLAKNYHVICLIRGDTDTARCRLYEIIGDIADSVEIISGDVQMPLAGVSAYDMSRLRGKVSKLVHGAASINFEGVDTLYTNVDGTQNVLNLAKAIGCGEFHFQSTAYIAGGLDFLGEEDLGEVAKTRNVYEWSKLKAEQLVRSCGIPHSIYRIGIVVGKQTTGEIFRYTGYYQFFFWFYYLREVLRQQWLANPQTLRAEGIEFDAEGFLHFPVNVDCSPTSTLNLVPIDWLVENMVELIQVPCEGKNFHLTHPQPEKFQSIMEWTLETLQIKSVRYRNGNQESRSLLLNSFQGKLDRGCRQYFPYINHEAEFGFTLIPDVLKNRYRPPVVVDKDFIEILMNEAVRVQFRKQEWMSHPAGKQKIKNVA